ncbi:hypothetical protein Hamer_G000562 [Homarus americanus]|uniref:Uncharacterized protein n=1 Tax=Homarus americanus TaxID=6706 RepID=A0A8J5NCL3_HOMAM|nr:hypothetical protein Hamer_G000562 [Homarus americanus]
MECSTRMSLTSMKTTRRYALKQLK